MFTEPTVSSVTVDGVTYRTPTARTMGTVANAMSPDWPDVPVTIVPPIFERYRIGIVELAPRVTRIFLPCR